MADSFVPVTFVADELLTSTKMNLLAANQAGFNDGTALGDGIIVTRHLATNAITAAKLASVPAGQEGWSAPALLNGWTNYDATTWDPVGYMKDSLGFVHIRGFLKGGTLSTGTKVFALPAGYRPAKSSYYCSGVNNSGAATSWQVSTNGDVIILYGGSSSYCSIGDIVFRAEG